ncbi:MAG: hypothetical protein ACRCUY_10230 [Thermoguttaceae bacterium]
MNFITSNAISKLPGDSVSTRRPRLLCIFFLLLFCFCGCESWRNAFKTNTVKAPPLLTSQTPTLAELTAAINQNSMSIRSLNSENATILVPGVSWPVRVRLAFERPKRLRIHGGATTLSGQEIDFGSNDTLFWLWVRRLPEKEIYFCRHDQFAQSPMRAVMPIEPDWVIEALGIIEFKPDEFHEGPFPAEDGNWAIITRRQTPAGQFIKRTVVDGKMGWILRQEVFSPQNELLAQAISSDHVYDPVTGVRFARRVEVQCQGSEGKMIINLGSPIFNQEATFPPSLFSMPVIDGYRPVDIGNPTMQSFPRSGTSPVSY